MLPASMPLEQIQVLCGHDSNRALSEVASARDRGTKQGRQSCLILVRSNGDTGHFSILSAYDVITTIVDHQATNYWADGRTTQSGVSTDDHLFRVSRYERDQAGDITVAPDPDWEMSLDLGYAQRWNFEDSKTNHRAVRGLKRPLLATDKPRTCLWGLDFSS